jgi:hypothetical protein
MFGERPTRWTLAGGRHRRWLDLTYPRAQAGPGARRHDALLQKARRSRPPGRGPNRPPSPRPTTRAGAPAVEARIQPSEPEPAGKSSNTSARRPGGRFVVCASAPVSSRARDPLAGRHDQHRRRARRQPVQLARIIGGRSASGPGVDDTVACRRQPRFDLTSNSSCFVHRNAPLRHVRLPSQIPYWPRFAPTPGRSVAARGRSTTAGRGGRGAAQIDTQSPEKAKVIISRNDSPDGSPRSTYRGCEHGCTTATPAGPFTWASRRA